MFNKFNFHDGSKADWKNYEPGFFLLKAYDERVRLHSEEDIFFEFDGSMYEVLYVSASKNAFYSSRQFSYYFRKVGSRSIIRISDHWSETTGYEKSEKLNCGTIRSCWWSCLKGKHFYYRFRGEKYDSRLIAGICSYAAFKPSPYTRIREAV